MTVDINEIIQSHGCTLLHFAARQSRLDLCEMLISKGAKPNLKDTQGNTPLHIAAQVGDLQVVKYLVTKGSDILLVNSQNQTPEEKAFYNGNTNVSDFLRQQKIKITCHKRECLQSKIQSLIKFRPKSEMQKVAVERGTVLKKSASLQEVQQTSNATKKLPRRPRSATL